jgi:Xaa-Pro aminopeptidase
LNLLKRYYICSNVFFMPKNFIQFLFLFLTFNALAQYDDNDLLSPEFHRGRREAVRNLMDKNSVAVFFASPIRNRSNDVNYEFHQNPNFYYLSGLKETDAVLLIFKDSILFQGEKTNEILFVQKRDPNYEVWDGKRLGVEGVKEKLGFKTCFTHDNFMNFNFKNQKKIYVDVPSSDIRDNQKNKFDLYKLVANFNDKNKKNIIDAHNFELNQMMAELRQIKLPEEIALMRKAIDITCEAQKELMRTLSESYYEYQAEAVVEYVFKFFGAEHPGFPSILGGGENSCILHYVTNRKKLNKGEMLVSDIGAEYHGYTADVTRTIPVTGKFSEEQKIIYNLVLKAQEKGIEVSKSGFSFWQSGWETKEIIAEGLISLGIIKQADEVGKYFMHGTSHYLGLDVHDVGTYQTLQPGMVVTVEPGIYIPAGSDCDPKWWNIGVRIEDDVLITDSMPEVLSGCVVKTIPEIEATMLENPIYFKD